MVFNIKWIWHLQFHYWHLILSIGIFFFFYSKHNFFTLNFNFLGLQDVPQIFYDQLISQSVSKKQNWVFFIFWTWNCRNMEIWTFGSFWRAFLEKWRVQGNSSIEIWGCQKYPELLWWNHLQMKAMMKKTAINAFFQWRQNYFTKAETIFSRGGSSRKRIRWSFNIWTFLYHFQFKANFQTKITHFFSHKIK